MHSTYEAILKVEVFDNIFLIDIAQRLFGAKDPPTVPVDKQLMIHMVWVFLTFIPDVYNVHERPHTSFRFVYARQQHHNMSTFSTPDTSLQTLLSPVDPTTDRDPSSISISIHLREELHRTSSRDLSKQCRLCFETLLYFPVLRVWRRIGELGHGLPGSLSKTGL